ncbi:MAG: universal stress protein [Thermoleophilia bacterium]|nr:universal stress protein [Thermoleophilia bacterium]
MSGEHPILLCYDGSDGAKEAIEVAGRLFGGGHAVVLNVVESLSPAVFYGAKGDATFPPTEDVPLHVPSLETGRRVAREGVAAAQTAGFDASPLVDITPHGTSHRIAEIADEYEAAAIVVGARGLSTLKSIVLGSTCHELVQHARCPVLVVHRNREGTDIGERE